MMDAGDLSAVIRVQFLENVNGYSAESASVVSITRGWPAWMYTD
jgi:hypothetical protein